jgi:GNAT superfamily N-acetyltransferase
MVESDIDGIARTFLPWHKQRPQYERYFSEQQSGERIVLVALLGAKVVGYVTLLWQTNYLPFRESEIPVISDLNVINEHQRQGIGTRLIQACERIAAERAKPVIGIGVGLTADYAAAQRLYPHMGYVPDGRGLVYHDHVAHYGEQVVVDDHLVLYFTKKLT